MSGLPAAPIAPCLICRGAGADKYLWCRPCIKQAARGAARYFMAERTIMMTHGDAYAQHDVLRRKTNSFEKKFKRKLRRR